MSFNIHHFFLYFLILIICSCGVKAKPAFPPDKAIQNYLDHFLIEQENEKK